MDVRVGLCVKKAERQRIDAFELWCWRRLLRVPWTARRSNQSILKEISPGISLEGLLLKLKLQNFGHLMRRVDSLEKTLMLVGLGAGGEGDDRGWDGWMASLTRWTWVWVNSESWWWTGRPGVLRFMGLQRVRHDWVTDLIWSKLSPIRALNETFLCQFQLRLSNLQIKQKVPTTPTIWSDLLELLGGTCRGDLYKLVGDLKSSSILRYKISEVYMIEK